MDWSTRLFNARVPQALVELGGFRLLPQTGHSPLAIDPDEPFVKCCNAAWQLQRVRKGTSVVNKDVVGFEALVGPCRHLMPEDRCAHHQGRTVCAFIDRPWVRGRVPLTEAFLAAPPLVDLVQQRKENGL